MCEISWYTQDVEHDGTQVMVMITRNNEIATSDDDQVLKLGKEREKQNPMEIKTKV